VTALNHLKKIVLSTVIRSIWEISDHNYT